MWGSGANTNILIASGDAATCLYVQILAHQDGIHASYFTQPEDVVRALKNDPQHWAAVFIDMLSPVMMKSGLVDQLQAIRPDVRLVILTSHVTEQVRQTFKQSFQCKLCPDCSEAKNRHCSFLHKPFYRDFDRVVHSALAGTVLDAPEKLVIQS
jgi:CheY-like chemotaxis protein